MPLPNHQKAILGVALIATFAIGVLLGAALFSSSTAIAWVSATSGWAAAIAAVATIGVLLAQLSEQRLQTKVAAGDLPLELTWENDLGFKAFGDPDWITLYAVNPGRYPVRIICFQLIGGPEQLAAQADLGDTPGELVTVIRASDAGERKAGRTFRHTLTIPGWFDRSQSPPKQQIRLCLSRLDREDSSLEGDETCQIVVTYVAMTDSPKRQQATLDFDKALFDLGPVQTGDD